MKKKSVKFPERFVSIVLYYTLSDREKNETSSDNSGSTMQATILQDLFNFTFSAECPSRDSWNQTRKDLVIYSR